MQAFFKNEEFNFLTTIALGAAARQAADVGEVLSTIERIHNGDARSWVSEWRATAERVRRQAEASAAGGHRVSAADAYLRASLYFSLAGASADGAGGEPLFVELWEEHRRCWDSFCRLGPYPCEQFEIPYEGTTLPGFFFRRGAPGERRRTLVFNNGSDGPMPAAWVQGLADALARGWNACTFDGPGQNAALVRQGLAFRPDWEHVLTPVVERLLERDDVDPGSLALLGVSQAGYWVPRAVAFEPRIAAAVADPGVVDVSTVMWDKLPHRSAKLLEAGEQEKFDRQMATAERFSKSMAAMLAARMRPYGTSSVYEMFTAARRFALSDEVIARIRCPILVTDPEGEQFWPGQSAELYEKLTGEKELVAFTEHEGADLHCEPAATALRAARIFDWLDERVPGPP